MNESVDVRNAVLVPVDRAALVVTDAMVYSSICFTVEGSLDLRMWLTLYEEFAP